jgi:hypothetical protein
MNENTYVTNYAVDYGSNTAISASKFILKNSASRFCNTIQNFEKRWSEEKIV